MRLFLCLAAVALTAGACTDYFDGTNLYFEFQKLPILNPLLDEDANPPPDSGKTPVLCADEGYYTDPTATMELRERRSAARQPYEYHAWATINGGPVRLVRFTTRDCTLAALDPAYKPLVTTLTYYRNVWGYPDRERGTQAYGVVDATVSSFYIGGAFMPTDVRLTGATEVFITREPAGVAETAPPGDTLLMRGDLVDEGAQLRGKLEKVTGRAEGSVVAVVVERAPAW